MFATLAGGYPFGPLPGLTRDFGGIRSGWRAGVVADDAFQADADRHVREIAAEQVASGLELVEDGLARFPGDAIDGLAAALMAGSIGPDAVAAAWSRLDGCTEAATKAVVPGPALLLAAQGGGHSSLERALEVAVGCIAGLVDAGCGFVVLQERLLDATSIQGLEGLVVRIPSAIHRCLAMQRVPDVGSHARIADLPVSSHLVDVTAGAPAWRFIASLPGSRGVIVGAAPATRPELDDPEMLLWAATLAAELGERGADRVGVAPSGSLAGLDRHQARRKIERLGEAVRLSRLGPIGEVARALQPDPASARIPSLRQLIADHRAAGLSTHPGAS